MDDYLLLIANFDDYGTDLYGCTRCGVAVFDREKHDEVAHPVATPFAEEEEVDLDDIPDDEELPDVPEDEENPNPTPEVVVINPNGS